MKSDLGPTLLQILQNLPAQVGLAIAINGILILMIGNLIFSINPNRGAMLWILPPDKKPHAR
ncbi:hypothetical protein L0337_29305 [candidate division KSB1 bacterium]|nr:hypothetical protein [candidate division KSB1 bacterium]